MIPDPKFTRLLNAVAASTAAHDRAVENRAAAFAAYEHRGHMIQAEQDERSAAIQMHQAEHALCRYLLETGVTAPGIIEEP